MGRIEQPHVLGALRQHGHEGVLVALGLGLLVACRAPTASPEVAKVERPAALEVWAAGCSTSSPAGACLLARGATLSLWLPLSVHDPLELDDGAPLPPLDRAVRDTGLLLRVVPRPSARAIRLVARTGTTSRQHTLTLARPDASTAHTATRTPEAALAEARRALRSGDTGQALDLLTQAEAGAPWVSRRAAMLGAYVAAVMRGDHAEAARRVARVGADDPLDGEGAALADYHRGLLHAMVGDRRAALEVLERAARTATRLDLGVLDAVHQLEALQLLEIGRAGEAVALLERLAERAEDLGPAARADLLNNLASARIVAGGDLSAARRELGRALEDYATAEAVVDANNARVSLALLELEDGQRARAARLLAAVSGPQLPVTSAWHRLLRGRIALDAGRPAEACPIFARLAADAGAALWRSLEARAELGAGDCHRAAGRMGPALEAYRRAEAALIADGAAAPIDRGTLERLDGWAEVEARIVTLLLHLGRPREAFEAARRRHQAALARVAGARAREVQSPAERDRWLAALAAYRRARDALDTAAVGAWQGTTGDAPRRQAELEQLRAEVQVDLRTLLGPTRTSTSRDPLPAPQAGELRLVAVTIDARRLILAATTEQVLAEWVPETAGVQAAIAAAAHLRVVASPPPELRALLGDRPWAFTTDLPPRAAPPPTRRALVVADPRRDLPQARREGEEVAAQLRDAGWSVDLRVGEQARRTAIEAALGEVELFHYAGHGRDLSERRWDGALLLADGELEVADVVATRAVPRWVALSGCQTAVIGQGDLTLAQAFVLAGAEAVVATATVVDDRVARDFSRRFYAGPATSWSLEDAYGRAHRAADAFRLLVR